MKVFLSHSSRDKWAARRISNDLAERKIETFLDEKDIRTGQSIDESIRKNLHDCSDFLILLSPASLKSDWVLLELGGALALEKRIIPILLYVGVNEVPQAISLKLSRDINDIEEYYKELAQMISGKPAKKAPDGHKEAKFGKGDTVRVFTKEPTTVLRGSKAIEWEDRMDRFLGGTFKIEGLAESGPRLYLLEGADTPTTWFVFAEEWLEKI